MRRRRRPWLRIACLLLLALLAASAVFGTPAPPLPLRAAAWLAGPPPGCSDATLSGAYGFEGSGLLFVDSNSQPVAMLGTVNFDGAGQGTGQIQLNLGTAFATMPLGGLTYRVNPDCTGYVSRMGFGATLIILDGGAEIDLREADGIGAVTGVAKPLADPCSEATLDGSYLLSTQGRLITSAADASVLQFVPTNSSGTQTFDGMGGSQRSYFDVSVDGQPSQGETESGSYQLNADCSGDLSLVDSSGRQESESLVTVAGGREAWFVSTTPNIVVLGTLAQQSLVARLEPVAGQTVNATATLTAEDGGTRVSFSVTGLEPGVTYESQLNAGTCDMPSASFTAGPTLTAGANGEATASGLLLFHGAMDISLRTLTHGDIISIAGPGGPVACGSIPRAVDSRTDPE